MGAAPSSIHKCWASSPAGTRVRNWISNSGCQGRRLTSARQIDRTRTRPCSAPLRHRDRTTPSSRASPTTAHASSSISRRSVSSHDSPASGRPPGHPHRVPSVLTSTTSCLAVTQNALAPCGSPFGTSPGGCQAIRQSPPLAGTAVSSKSPATGPSPVLSIFTVLLEQEPGDPPLVPAAGAAGGRQLLEQVQPARALAALEHPVPPAPTILDFHVPPVPDVAPPPDREPPAGPPAGTVRAGVGGQLADQQHRVVGDGGA